MKDIGQVLMGFGILMLGMAMMSNSVAPLRHNTAVVEFIGRFSTPILGLLVGLCMTVVIQSSSATVGILMAMAGQGLIPLEGAVPVLLGITSGRVLPPFWQPCRPTSMQNVWPFPMCSSI